MFSAGTLSPSTIPRLQSDKVLRRTLRDEWTNQVVGVRLSAEQRTLSDLATRLGERLNPKTS